MPEKQLVYTVKKVTAEISLTSLLVEAEGETRTSGWTQPELVQVPADSADQWAFEFVAIPPSGSSADVITPIRASYRSGPLKPPFPTAVVVVAEINRERVLVTK